MGIKGFINPYRKVRGEHLEDELAGELPLEGLIVGR